MYTLAKEKIPEHLPEKLTISFWNWCWLTDTNPGEPFSDIEKCFIGLAERGFNTIRIDAMLGWIYDSKFNRRNSVKVGRIAQPGFINYGPAFKTTGGFYVNAYEKLLELFSLAKKHNIYIILTTWQYQDGHSTTLIGDDDIRNEIYAIPLDKRLMFIARQYTHLLNDLKSYGYFDRIAFVELHNEIDCAKVFDRYELLKELMDESLKYLQERFPELIISTDRVIGGFKEDGYGYDYDDIKRFVNGYALNEKLIDHHLYSWGIQGAIYEETGMFFNAVDGEEIDEKMREVQEKNDLFNWIIKKDREPWDSYKTHFEYLSAWRQLLYFYENMDVDRYDYWMFKNYPKYEQAMKSFWKNSIQHISDYASKRNLPLVCDEGYVFWPPMHSQFEISAVGKEFHEYIINLMIKYGYWGITISTYSWPGQPLWEKEPEFLKKLNNRILGISK